MPHSNYLPEKMGSATVSPAGAFEAGSFQEFTVTYTAGYFGIDDTGSLKVVHRFASDMGRPQFDDPTAPNYTTVEATNGAVLLVEYDMKRNVRPWDKTLYIKVVRGYLCEGDQIIIRFGDRRRGSPGIRLQTFCEHTFEFRVLVDPFAVYQYVEVPDQPVIAITPGLPVLYKCVMPTLRRLGQVFQLRLKGEDRWGNPSNQCEGRFSLKPSSPVQGLPEMITFTKGEFSVTIDGLSVGETGDVTIDLVDDDGQIVCTSNPLRVTAEVDLLAYWGDLHGQSEETIGTNSARDYYTFARDYAFLDACVHQGNDFQITNEFWEYLNELSAEFTEDNKFIVFPGWEWSGNTGLGGDRNVLHMYEGKQIHRSSHALLEDLSDVDTDANSSDDLFKALQGEDCLVFAHVGGRYADINISHDISLEKSIEVHSAWGTFEWLINDAFKQGQRVGIVSNSDGHKGRPGASHPGSAKFGSYGGLTCMLAPSFSRAGFMEALQKRHHYGTTGSRVILDTRAVFDNSAELFSDDPELTSVVTSKLVNEAIMGDILRSDDREVLLKIDVHGPSPIERIDIRNGLETIEVYRPYQEADLGRRIRILWEGSEYRGRGRETIWDGHAELHDNTFLNLSPINHYNLNKRFEQVESRRVEWEALTTGGFGGFEAILEDGQAGTLKIDTALIQEEIPIKDIGRDELVFANGGIDRRIRIFRMPDENPHSTATLERRIKLAGDRDNGLYVRITHEDGHFVWSSPIYIFR